MKSVKIVLRNYQTKETLDYNIIPKDTPIAQDWIVALEQDVLQKSLHLDKNYCFHGFPETQRDLNFLCKELNKHIYTINQSKLDYTIETTLNPNQIAPLTAMLNITSEVPCQATIKVLGDIPVEQSFKESSTNLNIPVLGLYANKLNKVEVTLNYDGGKQVEIIEIQTSEVPNFFPEIGKNDTKTQTAIELLESDHVEIGRLINDYTASLQQCSTPTLTSTKADTLLSLQSVFNTALTQHLDDEEEIIVPAALHFGYIR